jgi:ribonuclease D
MRDNVLLDIAWHLPRGERELADIKGVPPKLVTRVGHELLDAISKSAEDDPEYQPPPRPDESQKALLKEMQARVADCASKLDIAAETVASKRELSAVIIGGSRDSRVFTGWRGDLVGKELAELL